MSESLCYTGIHAQINWSPSGEFFCGLPTIIGTDTLAGVYRTRTFGSISAFPYWLNFIHGDTLVGITVDSINQKIYFFPPPNFSHINDSVVFLDTVFRELVGLTEDGRFWLFFCIFERPYHFMIYDRFRDSLWFIEDSTSGFYLSKKGFLITTKQTRLIPGECRYTLSITNLYHPTDTIFFTDMIGLRPVYVGDLWCNVDFSNNDSIVYIPFRYSDASFKEGILIYNLYDRSYIDTIDTIEIYQDDFIGIENTKVTQDGKYAILSLSYWATAFPYMIAERTILYDLINHHQIYTIDTICRFSYISISPKNYSISKIVDSKHEKSINVLTHTANNMIIISNPTINVHILLSLLDLTGHTVHRWQVGPIGGDKLILPLPEELPNGIYFLKAGNGKIVGKVVLVK